MYCFIILFFISLSFQFQNHTVISYNVQNLKSSCPKMDLNVYCSMEDAETEIRVKFKGNCKDYEGEKLRCYVYKNKGDRTLYHADKITCDETIFRKSSSYTEYSFECEYNCGKKIIKVSKTQPCDINRTITNILIIGFTLFVLFVICFCYLLFRYCPDFKHKENGNEKDRIESYEILNKN